MQSVIELADLSAEQQLCLETAVRCAGLTEVQPHLWTGTLARAGSDRRGFVYRATVEPLIDRGLLRRGLVGILPTDAGIELVDCGRVARAVAEGRA